MTPTMTTAMIPTTNHQDFRPIPAPITTRLAMAPAEAHDVSDIIAALEFRLNRLTEAADAKRLTAAYLRKSLHDGELYQVQSADGMQPVEVVRVDDGVAWCTCQVWDCEHISEVFAYQAEHAAPVAVQSSLVGEPLPVSEEMTTACMVASVLEEDGHLSNWDVAERVEELFGRRVSTGEISDIRYVLDYPGDVSGPMQAQILVDLAS